MFKKTTLMLHDHISNYMSLFPFNLLGFNFLHLGIEYRIPPLWKRLIAEFLDFFMLFFFKLAVTFMAVDFDLM